MKSRIERFLAENKTVSAKEFDQLFWQALLVKAHVVCDSNGGVVSGNSTSQATQEAAELVMTYYENRAS